MCCLHRLSVYLLLGFVLGFSHSDREGSHISSSQSIFFFQSYRLFGFKKHFLLSFFITKMSTYFHFLLSSKFCIKTVRTKLCCFHCFLNKDFIVAYLLEYFQFQYLNTRAYLLAIFSVIIFISSNKHKRV